MTGYPIVPPHPSFPALEREVLDFWAADGTFAAGPCAAGGWSGASAGTPTACRRRPRPRSSSG
ncbi:MAG: Isoleucyl-tRNA synthetase [uncultured Pseudonocardia sp.]|uniref:Isoleucyl-tRNA synthetase n=1 Tax=uncultured Pseudonocardia sp. TaxID=211455 RepID=A0A6J4PFS8_9PSEU|nr:MAG: Isoleucyl-tRNA synthetase [uncultured Pseudonocardia sp.]